jgi:hypothetical protein
MAGEAWWENCFLPLYNYMSPTSILFRYLPIAISLSVCCPLSGCTVHSLHCYLLTYVGQTSKTSHAGGEARWTGLGNLIVPLRELHPTMPNHARGAVRSVRRCITHWLLSSLLANIVEMCELYRTLFMEDTGDFTWNSSMLVKNPPNCGLASTWTLPISDDKAQTCLHQV